MNRDQKQGLTFQQARATIAHEAVRSYSRVELLERLYKVDPFVVVGDDKSAISIAYLLVWRLLPAREEIRP